MNYERAKEHVSQVKDLADKHGYSLIVEVNLTHDEFHVLAWDPNSPGRDTIYSRTVSLDDGKIFDLLNDTACAIAKYAESKDAIIEYYRAKVEAYDKLHGRA